MILYENVSYQMFDWIIESCHIIKSSMIDYQLVIFTYP